MKILIADDHVLIRDALRHLLDTLVPNAEVLEAADCPNACRLINQHPDLDLALLDLRLPGAGGLATLEKIRAEFPALPVVVVSAHEDADTVRHALARGALGFIPKSSSNEVILNALRLVLAGGRYVPPEGLSRDGTAAVLPGELRLTDRQHDVLALMVKGMSNKVISYELGLSEPTVKVHVSAILRAFKVASRAQAIVAANRLGLSSSLLERETPLT